MSDLQSNQSNANLPPRVSGDQIVQSAATAAAAVSSNLWSGYTGGIPPAGKVWVVLEATGFDVFVRFSATNTTGTTAANGRICKVGVPQLFFIEPNVKDLFLDHISPGGVGTIKWHVCSQIGDRYRA